MYAELGNAKAVNKKLTKYEGPKLNIQAILSVF